MHVCDKSRLKRQALTNPLAIEKLKPTMCDISHGPQSFKVSQPAFHTWNYYHDTGWLSANVSLLCDFGGNTGEQTSVLPV